jgi:DNA (cytosine-5)-methyltransferase 1
MEFPRKVLDYHFPNADSHIDICKTDFTKYANTIDILTGGFPCQPFSLAGKRKGTDDERYLWGEMLRAIQEIKPKFVIAENVYGITNIDGGLVFQQVCLDLENQGYEVQPFIIPAAAKNAPHRRDRCWFIAYANGNDGRSTNRESGCEESETNGEGEQSVYSRIGATSNEGIATDTNTSRLHKQHISSKPIEQDACCRSFNERGDFSRFPIESPICGGDDGIPTKLDGITFSNWRNQSIKGYGNAIVPQIAYQLFQIINDL